MADVTTTFAAKDESFAKTVGNLQGRLANFGGSVTGFSSQVSGMASSFAKFAGPLAAVGLAFLGAKSAVQAFTEAISMGGKLNDLSSRTGETAGNLAILQRAFDNAGSSADAVGPVLNKLQRAIVNAGEEGGKFGDLFKSLGISMEEFKGKTPTEQLQIVAKALSEVEDPSKRSQLAMELLGKSGGELLPVLRAMGVELETARAQLGSYPAAIDIAAKALDDIGDNFNAISKKGMEFATGLLVDLAPALAEITAKIAEIDAAGFGMMISDYVMKMVQGIDGALRFSDAIENIKIAIDGMTQGEMGKGLELMWVTMKITALNAINEIIRNFMAGLQTIGDFIGKMFSPSGALVLLIQTAFTIGANYFKEAIFSAMAEVAAHFGPWGQKIAKTMQYQAETASNQIKTLTNSIGSQIEEVGYQAAEAGAAMPDTFAAKKGALDPLFDLKDEFAEQKRLQDAITAKIAQAAEPAAEIAKSAKVVSLALGGVPETLQSSVDLSGQLFTNLNNASIAASDVEPAFSLAADSTGKMALDLETTSASAGTAGEFIEQANYATSQMSLNGSNFAASAALAAANVGAAKVDAKITADAFTGMSDRMKSGANAVNSSLDKMREAFHFGQKTHDEIYQKARDGGQSIIEASKTAADYMRNQEKGSSDMRAAENKQRIAENKHERAYDRAAKMEERKQDTAANNLRRRADKDFSDAMKEIAPELKKAAEEADKALKEGGEAVKDNLQESGDGAGQSLIAGGQSVANALASAFEPVGDDQDSVLLDIYQFLKDTFFNDFKKRLPQNALS